MSWQYMLGVGTALVLLIVRSIRKSIREDKEKAEKQELARQRAAIEAQAQAVREAQELKVRQEREAREEAVRIENNRRIARANSIFEMRITAVGDLITICQCRGFFMRVEVDPVRRDVACEWRFDLWKGAAHEVTVSYCSVERIADRRHSYETHDRTFSDNAVPLSSSAFRKDRKVVRGLSGGRTYEFRFLVTSSKACRVFYVEAYVPADPSEYIEQDEPEHEQVGNAKQQSRLREYKGLTDVLRREIRQYINEVKSNPDLTDEEKDDEIANWEMIYMNEQKVYLRRTLGIDITGDA